MEVQVEQRLITGQSMISCDSNNRIETKAKRL